MKDNEIIKALKCAEGVALPCLECSYKTVAPFPECRLKCVKDALHLINRQKAEIEKLKKELAKQKAVLEAINDVMMPLPFETDFDRQLKTAKSEAIKEFAERLKLKADGYNLCGDGVVYKMVDVEDIDNLVKEMTEENQ